MQFLGLRHSCFDLAELEVHWCIMLFSVSADDHPCLEPEFVSLYSARVDDFTIRLVGVRFHSFEVWSISNMPSI
jgi:hypothetical protein